MARCFITPLEKNCKRFFYQWGKFFYQLAALSGVLMLRRSTSG
ncbi:MAG TPA: hypothetical protein VGC89_12605 [Pyrinomonadaceae bacterium]